MAIKLTIYGLDWPKLVAKMARILHRELTLGAYLQANRTDRLIAFQATVLKLQIVNHGS